MTARARKKVSHRTLPTEAQEQKALIEWASLKNIPLIHIPNEGKRSAFYGKQLKAIGLQPGFPDLFLPQGFGGFFGMFIELKRKEHYSSWSKGTKIWLLQEAWIDHLNANGYYAKFAFGCDHAIEMIEIYTSFEPTKRMYG